MTNKQEIGATKSFADRLSCIINGGSIRGFAHKCNISEGAVRNYLAGGEPTRPALIAIASATGVSLLWLASGQGPMREPKKASDEGESKGENELEAKLAEKVEKLDQSIYALQGSLNKDLVSLVRRLLEERGQLENKIELLASENEKLRSLVGSGESGE